MIPLTDHMKIVGMDETTSDSDFRLLFLHAIGELDAELPPHLKLLASIIDSDQSKLVENRERKIENARERRRRYSAKFKSEKDASGRDGTHTDASGRDGTHTDATERDGTPTDATERDGTLGNASTIPYHTIPTIPTERESDDAPAPTRGDVPALSVVVSAATSVMGVPEYYARWWYGEMNARDWRKTDGGAIGNGNWRAVLKSWWNKETDAHKAEIKAEAEKPAPVPVTFTAEDWQLCRERCAHCGPCGCQKGAKTPPQLDATHPHTPEECPRYAKKREIPPVTPSAPPGRTRTPPKRTNAPQGRKSTDFEPSAVPEP